MTLYIALQSSLPYPALLPAFKIVQGHLHRFGVVAPGLGHFTAQADVLQRQVKSEAALEIPAGDPRPAHVHLEAFRAGVVEQLQQVFRLDAGLLADADTLRQHRQVGHADEIADQLQRAGGFDVAEVVDGLADDREGVQHLLVDGFLAAGEDGLLGLFGMRRGLAEGAFQEVDPLGFGRVGKFAGGGGVDGADVDVSGAWFRILARRPLSPSMTDSRCWGSGRLVNTTSAPASSSIFAAARPVVPAARVVFTASGLRSNTHTFFLARIRLRASPPPIWPTPMNPNCMTVSPCNESRRCGAGWAGSGRSPAVDR